MPEVKRRKIVVKRELEAGKKGAVRVYIKQNETKPDAPTPNYVSITIEGITIRLSDGPKGLVFEIFEGDKLLKSRELIKPNNLALEDYSIDDLGSGTNSKGVRCISIALYEKEMPDSDMPFAREISFSVSPDGVFQDYDENRWSDGESSMYFVFSPEKDGFTLF